MLRKSALVSMIGVAAGCAASDGETAAVTEALAGDPGTTAWSHRVAGALSQRVWAVAPDAENGVYIAGETNHDLWYRGDEVALRDHGDTGPFLARIDPDGNLLWAKSDPEHDPAFASALGSNAAGDVVVAGRSDGAVVDLGCEDLDPAGEVALWITSFDAAGNCRFARSFPLDERPFVIFGVEGATVLPDGGVVVVGHFTRRMDLDGVIIEGHESETQAATPYVIALGADGGVRWAKAFRPVDDPATVSTGGHARGVDHDASGQVIVVGSAQGTLAVDDQLIVPLGPGGAAFIVRIAADGAVLGAEAFGERASASSVDVRGDGIAAVGGTFRDNLQWRGGVVLSTPGNTPDGFVVKLDATGAAMWSRRTFGSNLEQEIDVSIDVNGFVGLAGAWSRGTVNLAPYTWFGDGSLPRYSFVARLGAASGETMWAKMIAGAYVTDLAATGNRRLVLGGVFSTPTDFGDRVLTPNQEDGFVVRLFP
jgi:hypothetical protein